MYKKIIISVLVVVMLAVAFVGCTNTETAADAVQSEEPAGATESAAVAPTEETVGETSDSAEEVAAPDPFKIGYLDIDGEAPTLTRMREIVRSVVETAGGELVSDTTGGFAVDSELNAIEQLISAGVSGIILSPAADSMLPTAIKMCEEAGVYLTLSLRSIEDPEVKELVEASPYYAGAAHEDEYAAGYAVMEDALAQRPGIKKIALITRPVGDNTADAREAGLRDVCAKNGVEIVAEIRNIEQPSDGAEAIESLVAAFPDLDCIYVVSCMSPSAITAMPSVLAKLNVSPDDICLVGCDTGDDLNVLIDSGYAISFGGGHLEMDRCAAATLCVDAVLGTTIGDVTIPYLYFRTTEDVDNFNKYVEGDIPIYTPEEIQSLLLPYYNSSLTAEDVINQLEGWSLDSLVARRAGM